VTYTHAVDASGVQQLQQFYDQNRNFPEQSPFYVSLNHPSGSSLTIVPSGDITILEGNITQAQVNLANDGTVIVQGGIPNLASMEIDPDGVITLQTGTTDNEDNTGPTVVLDPQAETVTITGENNKSSIFMDGSGDINITAAGAITISSANGLGTISMAVDGSITITSLSTIVSIEAAVAASMAAPSVSMSGAEASIIGLVDIGLHTTAHPLESVNTIITTYNEHFHYYFEDGIRATTSIPIQQMP
jgi:hypothetical protein